MTLQLGSGLGAVYLGNNRCRFRVWAPNPGVVETVIILPQERVIPMRKSERGYWEAVADNILPGSLYYYRLDGTALRADPVSRFQPWGVQGPSMVIDPRTFRWEAPDWRGIPLERHVFYELHVGTFTPEGTFDAVIAHLDEFLDLGVTAIELMPVAQFPGWRNWGYDGVFLFAPQNSYGGPDALKRLVDACHTKGLAVVLDVVYNHLGPEGNYLNEFGPYFSDVYRTPWGAALNFDGPFCDEVRTFFVENALYWVTDFRIDALRMDAIHGIVDFSAVPFLKEAADAVHERGAELSRNVFLIAESNLNDVRPLRPGEEGGFGLDAQWSDDFHHALHVLLTGDRMHYYQDFGEVAHLAKAFEEGFVYTGQYSEFARRRHGVSSRLIAAHQFVVFSQNHDQVGNRAFGDRLGHLVPFEGQKLAAGVVLLSPFLPLLFMGQEYGETARFLYFVSHTNPELIEAVREGRKREFTGLHEGTEPPDPQSEETFFRSKLNRELRREGRHRALREMYRELIRLRKELPCLARLSKEDMEVRGFEREKVFFVRRWAGDSQGFAAFNFADARRRVEVPVPPGRWRRLIDSEEMRWGGGGPAMPEEVVSEGVVTATLGGRAFVLYRLDGPPGEGRES